MRPVSRAFFYAPPVPSPVVRDSAPTQPTALLQRYCCFIKNQLVNNCVVYIYYISNRVIHYKYIFIYSNVTHATAAFLCLRCAPRILYSIAQQPTFISYLTGISSSGAHVRLVFHSSTIYYVCVQYYNSAYSLSCTSTDARHRFLYPESSTAKDNSPAVV